MDNRNTLDRDECPRCRGEGCEYCSQKGWFYRPAPEAPAPALAQGEERRAITEWERKIATEIVMVEHRFCSAEQCFNTLRKMGALTDGPQAPPAQAPAPGREDLEAIQSILKDYWEFKKPMDPEYNLPPVAQDVFDALVDAFVGPGKPTEGGPEAPETEEREKLARVLLRMFQDQRVFPAGTWEEYDDVTRAQMLQYADRVREAAPASVKAKPEPSPNLDLYRDENKHLTRFKKDPP